MVGVQLSIYTMHSYFATSVRTIWSMVLYKSNMHMLLLDVFFMSYLFELIAIYLTKMKKLSSTIAILAFGLILCAIVLSLGYVHIYTSLTFFILSSVRILNMSRIIKSRMHAAYLAKAVKRTALYLAIMHATLALILLYSTPHVHLLILCLISSILALTVIFSTVYRLKNSMFPAMTIPRSDDQLPTLSILIPARNETTDLGDCLATIIASNYPKLEILVLDDCSSDQTSQLIKSYAHDGVRFIEGSEPKEHWLAKNQAYETLLEASSGEYVLCMGVDLRMGVDDIRNIISYMMEKNFEMVSILPKRGIDVKNAYLIQGMRYAWELALPRIILNRPPVLSSCWFAKRDGLLQIGGFSAVTRQIVPEAYFAKQFNIRGAYKFLTMNDSGLLHFRSMKSVQEQLATSDRTRYPQLHRKPEMALLVILLEMCLVAPYVFTILGLIMGGHMGLIVTGFICSCLVSVSYAAILIRSMGKYAVIGLLLAAYALILDMILIIRSMVKYEFGNVVWKERNICLPIMHVTPRLPEV